MTLSIKPFEGVDPQEIVNVIRQAGCEVVSIQFRCSINTAPSVEHNHWLRLQNVLSHPLVYQSLGIYALPTHASFGYTRGLEVIGTVANLLNHDGVHGRFVSSYEHALTLSRNHFDKALLRNYDRVEAYSSHQGWCDWFCGDGLLDELVLVGNGDDWWLLAVTDTD